MIFNKEKLREEIRKELREEIRKELMIELNDKALAIEESAKKIIENATLNADYIKINAQEEIESKKQEINKLATELARKIEEIKHLKKIVREKNLANLRNLARSVPPERVRKEIIRANKQLIYLQDLEENAQNLLNQVNQ